MVDIYTLTTELCKIQFTKTITKLGQYMLTDYICNNNNSYTIIKYIDKIYSAFDE